MTISLVVKFVSTFSIVKIQWFNFFVLNQGLQRSIDSCHPKFCLRMKSVQPFNNLQCRWMAEIVQGGKYRSYRTFLSMKCLHIGNDYHFYGCRSSENQFSTRRRCRAQSVDGRALGAYPQFTKTHKMGMVIIFCVKLLTADDLKTLVFFFCH